MDWEKRFNSILKEIDVNLTNVQTDSNITSAFLSLSLNDSRSNTDPYNRGDRFTSSFNCTDSAIPSDNRQSMASGLFSSNSTGLTVPGLPAYTTSAWSHTKPSVDFLHHAHGQSEMCIHTTLDQSPGLMTLLSDKIDAQNRLIESLSQTVKQLEKERSRSSLQTSKLQDEVLSLKRRLEEEGISLQTEQKVNAWQQGVMTQLQLVQSELGFFRQQAESGTGGESSRVLSTPNNQITAVLREIQDLKKVFRDETSQLHNTVEALKRKMLSVETDLYRPHTAANYLPPSHLLDRSFRGSCPLHHSSSHLETNAARLHSRSLTASPHIGQLRTSIGDIAAKLQQMEGHIYRKSTEKPGSSLTNNRTHDQLNKPGNRKPVEDRTPDLSDLELDLTTPEVSDDEAQLPEDGRTPGMLNYDDLDDDIRLSSEEHGGDNLDDLDTHHPDAHDHDDDAKTENFDDLDLSVGDLERAGGQDDDGILDLNSDEELSIDHLQ